MTRKLVGTHLRSLLLTNFVRQQWQDDPIRMVTGFHPNNLKYLTTLALERKRIRIDEFNKVKEKGKGKKKIVKCLIHLRYLSLRWSDKYAIYNWQLIPTFTERVVYSLILW